jgi:hypothetical protein
MVCDIEEQEESMETSWIFAIEKGWGIFNIFS